MRLRNGPAVEPQGSGERRAPLDGGAGVGEKAAPAEPLATSDKISILVVDDTPSNLVVYRAALEELNERLVLVSSGAEALREILREDFAVILLDVNMPELDGFETAALIRQRRKSALTPIIFLTAFTDEVRTAKGYAHGAVDYLPTPIVPEILRAKVRVFVELFRMRRQIAHRAEAQLALAEQRIALAEERSKRLAAEESSRGLAFLARAGTVLGRSLNFETTARDLAGLPVPFLADRCLLLLTGPRTTEGDTFSARLCSAGTVTVQVGGREIIPEECVPAVEQALDSGEIQTVPPGGGLETGLPVQALALPLRARGDTLGVLLLAVDDGLRRFGPAELTIADALASRAAVALDHALLYENVQRADRHKNEFMAMLAHELRNPLGPIRNSVQILRLAGPTHPELVQARDMIDRQVTHMARLVDDLLDATRIARGKILLRRTRCDLVRLVCQTVEDYQSVFEASGIALAVSAPAESVWVCGDGTRLAQIVGNLLHNAHKFTAPGGACRVELEVLSAAEAVIRVRDTGIGIDPAFLPRVFDVFTQGEHSLDRARGGLGLGLALVRGLAELHGGRVSVFSSGRGHGAEFCIHLPLSEPETADPVPAGASDAGGDELRILVIEDNRDAAESTRMLLKLAGHAVRTAATGAEGLDAAREFRHHVVLCDIGLPGMSGYDVARILRAESAFAGTVLIALTGYGRDEDQRDAQNAGFDLHLTKPVDYDILRRALNSVSTPR